MSKMKYTEEQRKVIDVRENCVVVAGAGAGKTAVLSERYLSLVKDLLEEGYTLDEAIESILTLTFTEKAAKEMKDRIYKKLKEAPELSNKSFDFNKSSISTIDSFCMQVVKNSPNTLGLSGSFAPDQIKVKEICSLSALEILEKYSDSEIIKNLIKKGGFNYVWKDIFVKFADDYFSISDFWDLEEVAKNRKVFIEKDLKNKMKEINDFYYFVKNQINNRSDKKENKLEKSIKDLNKFTDLKSLISDERLLEEFQNFSINKGSVSKGNLIDSDKMDFIKTQIDDFHENRNTILTYIHFLNNFNLHIEFSRIVMDYYKIVVKKKQLMGALSFSDISKGAVTILKENKKLRRFYKKKIRYIMVDEFQDNNSLQRDLLYLLAEKEDSESSGIPTKENLASDKLFFVGDEKQSIYKFRGADVSVFNNLQKDMSKTLSLSKNFRSDKSLMDKFNTLFTNIMVSDEENKDYEAKYSKIDATKDLLKNSLKDTPNFQVAIKDQGDLNSRDASKSEFFYISQFIKNSIENKLEVMKKDENTGELVLKPCNYDDFTILLKSSTKQNLLEEILKANNIPYKSEKMKSLFKEAIVNDILAVIKASVYKFDKVSIATVLRSPIINLSDEGFTKVLFEKDTYSKIEELSESSDYENRKYKKFIEITSKVLEMADNKSLSDIVTYIWHETGYNFYIIGQEHLAQYEEFFSSFLFYTNSCDEANMNVAKFIENTSLIIEDDNEKEDTDGITSLSDKKIGVRIMTIHKSKGLEFPITILADSNVTPKNKSNYEFFIYESKENPEISGPVFPIPTGDKKFLQTQKSSSYKITPNQMIKIFELEHKKEEKNKEMAELKRVFYVATTRAESHFLMTGVLKNQKTKNYKPNTILNLYLGEREFIKYPDNSSGEYIFIDENSEYTEDLIYNKRETHKKENKLNNRIKYLATQTPPQKIPHLKNQGTPSSLNTKLTHTEIEKKFKKTSWKIRNTLPPINRKKNKKPRNNKTRFNSLYRKPRKNSSTSPKIRRKFQRVRSPKIKLQTRIRKIIYV